MKKEIAERAAGSGGWVDYIRDGHLLSFPKEAIVDGFTIRIPTKEEWEEFCLKESATWAVGHRDRIIQELIEEMKRRYRTDNVAFDELWITVRFGPTFDFRRVLRYLGISNK